MCTVLSDDEIKTLLETLPAARMPGCGGKISDTFAGAGITSIADLQVNSHARKNENLSQSGCAGFSP